MTKDERIKELIEECLFEPNTVELRETLVQKIMDEFPDTKAETLGSKNLSIRVDDLVYNVTR